MTTRTAISVAGMPGVDGQCLFLAVGQDWNQKDDGHWSKAGTISRITVTDDLPGLHCNLERVRAYVGDCVIWEGPLHNLEGVTFEYHED